MIPFPIVPEEILARGPLALQAYKKALDEGKTSVKRVPIMLIGQGQSGKTSLKRSLKGERYNPKESSTNGIETDPSYCKVSTEIWKVKEQNQGTDLNPEALSYEHCTAQYVLADLKKERRELKSHSMKYGHEVVNEEGTSFEDDNEHSFQCSNASHSLTHEVTHGTLTAAKLEVPALTDPPDLSEVPKEIATLIEKLQALEINENEDEIHSILWDFGGQAVYYATHPLFLTTRAIYLLVYNLSRHPDKKFAPQEKRGFLKCERSNMDYLDFWMSSVSSLVSQDDDSQETSEMLPPVFLVCTHADKPYESIDPKMLADEIFDSLKTKIYGQNLLDVFVVDNTKSGGEEECPEVIRLRKEVRDIAKELPHVKEVIPIKWLKYEKAVGMLLEDGCKWISLEKAKKIALEVCGISSEKQFLTLLNFLHDQRILIHFDDTPELNKMVILDPQWLIDVFKKIITITSFQRRERKFRNLWRKLETTGILEEKLLQHVWGPLFDNQVTCNSLIGIMEKFGLLCPWPSSAESELPSEYVVPSMLMFPPNEDVKKLIASAGIPSLFVKFKSGQVPLGLFARLVVMVLQWYKKEVVGPTYQPKLHRNFARFFSYPAEGCSIILLCHSSSVEVVVHKGKSSSKVSKCEAPRINLPSESSHDTFQVQVARIVRRQLEFILECMRKEFHWLKNMAYEMSVSCPICCTRKTVNYCDSHRVRGCKEEECLHFWSESQLRDCQGFVVCTRFAGAEDYTVPIELFAPWFACLDEQVS